MILRGLALLSTIALGIQAATAEDKPSYKCTHYVYGTTGDDKDTRCPSFSTSAGKVKTLRECGLRAIEYYRANPKPGRCWGRKEGEIKDIVDVVVEMHDGYLAGFVWNSKATMEWENVKDLELEDFKEKK